MGSLAIYQNGAAPPSCPSHISPCVGSEAGRSDGVRLGCHGRVRVGEGYRIWLRLKAEGVVVDFNRCEGDRSGALCLCPTRCRLNRVQGLEDGLGRG